MNFNKGYLVAACYALAAFSIWVIGDALIKVSGNDFSLVQLASFNQIAAATVMLITALYSGGWGELKTKKPMFHGMRGVLHCGLEFMAYYSITQLALANFYALAFTAPLIIAFLSAVFFRERISVGIWLAIIIGFIGVLVATQPQHYDPVTWPTLAVLAILAANVCYAMNVITIKKGGQNETDKALVFYPSFITASVFMAIMFATGDLPQDYSKIGYVILSGSCYGAANLLMVAALRRAANSLIVPIQYSQIITGGIIGYLVWGDSPSWHLVAGVIIIVLAGLYIVWRGSQQRDAVV